MANLKGLSGQKTKSVKVYYVGPGDKVTSYYRANASCTMSEYELEEWENEIHKFNTYNSQPSFAQKLPIED